jgi:hypothetical protein
MPKLYAMKYLLLIIAGLILLSGKCKKKREEVFCQGQVIEETTQDAETGRNSYRMFLACASHCRDGSLCDSIVKEYDPPKNGYIVREVWCGCPGDQQPQGCDVIIQTQRFSEDTILRKAVCTDWNESCPLPADSCLPGYRNLKDTIKSVVTGKDSIYRFKRITACECMNRI